MIGYCNKLKHEIISEADCYQCKDVDLTCCRYWRDSYEASLTADRDKFKNQLDRLIFLIEQQPKYRYRSSWFQTVTNYIREVKEGRDVDS